MDKTSRLCTARRDASARDLRHARPVLILAALTAAGLASGCSGGGGGDGDPLAPSAAFASATESLGEGAGGIDLTVALDAPAGPLTSDFTVHVDDLGTGTATSGSDYAAFATAAVTFSAGAVTGDTQTVRLTAIADTVAEGDDETVALGLSNPVGGTIGAVSTSTITLEDAQAATVAFQSASTVTVDESTTTHSILVELSVTGGGTVGFDASFVCQDTGTGTATSGVDYAAIAPVAVLFASGASDGDTVSVDVDVIDDGDTEGAETVALELLREQSLDPSVAGTPSSHVLQITDDEVPASQTFEATTGPTGIEFTASHGDTLDLGTQTNNAGPNTGTYLRIRNGGQAAMALGAPLLTGGDPDDFAVELESSSLPPASSGIAPAGEDLDFASPLVRVERAPADGAPPLPGVEALYDPSMLAGLDAAETARLHGVPMPGLGDVTLALERVPLPIADDAMLVVDGAVVSGGPRAVLGDLSLWRGEIVEVPGSTVFLRLGAGGPEGFARLPYGEANTIHIHTDASSDAAIARIVHESDLLIGGARRPDLCGGAELVPGDALDLELTPAVSHDPPPTAGLVVPANARLAIETDYQLYQEFNSTSDLTTYVTSLIAAISDQYREDVQTTLSIAYLGVYTTAADPWTSQDSGGDAGDVLDEFRAAWNGSGWPATADLAHFISGASLGGGVAYVGVLCNQSFGYGVSGNINGNINWGTWTGAAGSFTWDFVVVAHELGHNFGASHTHSYCPPIDVCYSNCTSGTSCSQGTIMSYCHTCGGMDNIDLEFHPQIANIMRGRVETSCLGDTSLAAGDHVRYLVRFAPRSGTGAKSTTLRIDHDASNVNDPFELTLSGTSQ